jgi:hypothetical protein
MKKTIATAALMPSRWPLQPPLTQLRNAPTGNRQERHPVDSGKVITLVR